MLRGVRLRRTTNGVEIEKDESRVRLKQGFSRLYVCYRLASVPVLLRVSPIVNSPGRMFEVFVETQGLLTVTPDARLKVLLDSGQQGRRSKSR
jgi:hypothetical protein